MNAPSAEGASWEDFAEDIMESGEGICHRSAVEILAREARGVALELDAWGVPFTRMPSGRWASRTLLGSSKPWTLFAGDLTGHMLLQVLYERFLESQAAAYDEAAVVTLAVDDNGSHGAVAFDLLTGRLFPVAAKAVVLATGSMGQLYRRTTASLSCAGDGVALAYRAGAELRDMELVQFHPTVLAGTGVGGERYGARRGGQAGDKRRGPPEGWRGANSGRARPPYRRSGFRPGGWVGVAGPQPYGG